MTTTVQMGPAIVAGYNWSLRLIADDDVFPEGVALTGHVRHKISDTTLLATLSTTNGRIVRVDNRQVDIHIDGSVSSAWGAGSVVMDFVRTDVNPDSYLGFVLTVPVTLPVTRGLV
jgi:hypothetical protein